MSTLVELLRESTLIQGSVALVSIITICYLYATAKPVPDSLITIVVAILGYYFGSKTQQRMMRGNNYGASRNSTGIDTGTDRPTETGKIANP